MIILATSFVKTALGVGCGIVLAFLAMFVACGWFVANVGENMAEAERQKQEALSSINFEEVEGKIDGDWVRIEGKIRNNGSGEVSFIKIGVELLDSEGKVLDTDWTYAVSSEGLKPGVAKSFDLTIRKSQAMAQYRYFIMKE